MPLPPERSPSVLERLFAKKVSVLGILTAIALAIFAVVWYPLKRLLRRNAHPKALTSIDDLKKR
jgi:hypothetical protein